MSEPRDPNDAPVALVIEDDPVTCEFLFETLMQAGWDVYAARSVEEASRFLTQRAPRLVLSDVRLPDGDALAIAEILQSIEFQERDRPHAIALTAELDNVLEQRLRGAGFSDVLPKPVRLARLLDALPPASRHSRIAQTGDDSATAGAIHATCGGELPDTGVLLDDAAALDVCGNEPTVAALRALFELELPHALHDLEQAHAANNDPELARILHRLRSACGFCGALALQSAISQVSGAPVDAEVSVRDIARVLREGQVLIRHFGARIGTRPEPELRGP